MTESRMNSRLTTNRPHIRAVAPNIQLTSRSRQAEFLHASSACADIRRLRQDLLATPLSGLWKWGDYFSTSECRDLLFHVQEHQLSIREIERFLRENQLAFLGFACESDRDYRRHFPEDRAMVDLGKWHVFETENPTTFANMYQFWVQKPDA